MLNYQVCAYFPLFFWAVDNQIVFAKDYIIHSGSVVIKFFYKITHGINFKTPNVEKMAFHQLVIVETAANLYFQS